MAHDGIGVDDMTLDTSLIDRFCPQCAVDMSIAQLQTCLCAATAVGRARYKPPKHWTSDQVLDEMIKDDPLIAHFVDLSVQSAYALHKELVRAIEGRIAALPQPERDRESNKHAEFMETMRLRIIKSNTRFASRKPVSFECQLHRQEPIADTVSGMFARLGAIVTAQFSSFYSATGSSSEEKLELEKDK